MFPNAIQSAVATSKSGMAQDSAKILSFLASLHPHNLGSQGVPAEGSYLPGGLVADIPSWRFALLKQPPPSVKDEPQ